MLIHLPERLLICIEQDKGPSDSEVIVFWHSQFYIYHEALVDEYTHTPIKEYKASRSRRAFDQNVESKLWAIPFNVHQPPIDDFFWRVTPE
jgi:hypothetical protein